MPDISNPFQGDISMTAGSGSLEGEGKLMALPQNIARSCSFVTEGKSFSCDCKTMEVRTSPLWSNYTNVPRGKGLPLMEFAALPSISLSWGSPVLCIHRMLQNCIWKKVLWGFFPYTRPTLKRSREVLEAATIQRPFCLSLKRHCPMSFLRVHKAYSPFNGPAADVFVKFENYSFRVYELADVECKTTSAGFFKSDIPWERKS